MGSFVSQKHQKDILISRPFHSKLKDHIINRAELKGCFLSHDGYKVREIYVVIRRGPKPL